MCAEQGARTELYDGEQLSSLPIFDARDPLPHASAIPMVESIRRADAIVIASPGYHGSMSGLVKNALDHVEALRHDTRPYFDGRPVGLIVAAAGWQACGSTLTAMRAVVHALRGWPTPLAVLVNSADPQATAEPNDSLTASLRTMTDQIITFSHAMSVVDASMTVS
jgi:FMN reductase